MSEHRTPPDAPLSSALADTFWRPLWYGGLGECRKCFAPCGCCPDQIRSDYESLVERLETAEARLQHFKDCADTPLMRDVLAELDALRDAVDSFDSAYPESVFPEYGPGELPAAIAAIKAAGVSSERLHASWARHISRSIHRLARAALSGGGGNTQ